MWLIFYLSVTLSVDKCLLIRRLDWKQQASEYGGLRTTCLIVIILLPESCNSITLTPEPLNIIEKVTFYLACNRAGAYQLSRH